MSRILSILLGTNPHHNVQPQEREIFFIILEICTIQDIPCFHYKLCYLFNFSNFPTIYTKDLEMFLSVDIFIDHAQKSSQS